MTVFQVLISSSTRRVSSAGVLATDPAIARHYVDQGATFVAVGVDTVMLVQACRALAAQFKGA